MPNNISVSITADTAGLVAGRAVASAELKALNKDLADTVKAARDAGISGVTPEILRASDAFAKGQARVGLFNDKLRALKPAAEAAHSGMAGVTREIMVGGREIARGNWSRLAGSMTILAQRMGLLEAILSPVSLGVIAVAGSFALAALAAYKGEEEISKFNGAMAATNGYAGLTASSFQQMAQRIATETKTGLGKAKATLTELANSGKFTGDTLALIGVDATRMGELTGQGAEKMLGDFTKLGDGAAKFAKDYQDHYHQLTLAQFEYIEKLTDQGREEEAEHVLARNIYDYLGSQAPQDIGTLEAAWKGLAGAIGGAWEQLKNWGRAPTTAEQIAPIDARIAELKAEESSRRQTQITWDPMHGVGTRTVTVASPNDKGDLDRQIAMLEKQRGALVATEKAQQKTADARAAAARVSTDAIDAEARLKQQYDDSRTSGEKLAKAIADINNERAKALAAPGADSGLINRQADAAIAQARKSDAPPKGPKAKGEEGQFGQWQEDIQTQVAGMSDWSSGAAAQKEAEFWKERLGGLREGSSEYHQAFEAYHHALNETDKASYDALLENDKDVIADAAGNPAKLSDAWNKYLAELRQHYRTDSVEYERAQREKTQSDLEELRKRQGADTQRISRSTASAVHDDEAGGKATDTGLEAQADRVRAQEQMHVVSARQAAAELAQIDQEEAAADKATTERVLADTLAGLDKELAANVGNADKIKEIQQEITDAKQRARDREVEISQQAAKKELDAQLQAAERNRTAWMGVTEPIGSAFDQMFRGMETGQESFSQAAKKAGNDLLLSAVGNTIKGVERWAAGELAKTTATTAGVAAREAAENTGFFAKLFAFYGIDLGRHVATETGKTAATAAGAGARATTEATSDAASAASQKLAATAQVATLAGLAGAGGVASMAAAPFPLDLGAPAFGAAMAATTLGFGAFAKGMDTVPHDMIAQIHQGERIVPAADNAAMIDAMRGVGGRGGGGGDTALHYAPTIHAPASQSLKSMLEEQGADMLAFVQKAIRSRTLKLA